MGRDEVAKRDGVTRNVAATSLPSRLVHTKI